MAIQHLVWHRFLASISQPNTRSTRRASGNRLRAFHLDDIPNFVEETRRNRKPGRFVATSGESISKQKLYTIEEATALLRHLHILPEWMQAIEKVGCFMRTSPADSRNFLKREAPPGGSPPVYDLEARTYTCRRQKTTTKLTGVPIPQPVWEVLEPHIEGGDFHLPFNWPNRDNSYTAWHHALEEAAGVKRIDGRAMNAWRHSFQTFHDLKLPGFESTPKTVIKALMGQKVLTDQIRSLTEQRSSQKRDIISTYEHTWPEILAEHQNHFSTWLTDLVKRK